MNPSDVINSQWVDPAKFSHNYMIATPFPHIVLKNFIRADLLNKVATEFPDLAKQDQNVRSMQKIKEIKFKV